MAIYRPAFRYARFDDIREQGLGGWYAVVDSDAGRTHLAQLVFLKGFRAESLARPKMLVEFEPEARDVATDVERRSSWTGPFPTIEEARAEGQRLVG